VPVSARFYPIREVLMPNSEASALWQTSPSVLSEAGHKARSIEVAAAWRPLESTLVAPRQAAGVTH
jgi:hypothetical protein